MELRKEKLNLFYLINKLIVGHLVAVKTSWDKNMQIKT